MLGVLKRWYDGQVESAPQGENEIVIQPKGGKPLFFAHEPGIKKDLVPIFMVGEESEFGLGGYCEETGEMLDVSVDEVVNA